MLGLADSFVSLRRACATVYDPYSWSAMKRVSWVMTILRKGMYPHIMSTSALPPVRRPRKTRLALIGLRAASDQSGVTTFRAINRAIQPVQRSSMSVAANRVTDTMNPPKK